MTQTQITLVLLAAHYLLAPVLVWFYQMLSARLPDKQHAQVKEIVTSAVRAVEQIGGLLNGEQKRLEAVRMIQSMLGSLNIKADDQTINTYLEEAVYLLNPPSLKDITLPRIPAVK